MTLRRYVRLLFVTLVTIGLLSASASHSTAATRYWRNNAGNGNWNDPAKWSSVSAADTNPANNGVPLAGEPVNIVHTDGTARTVTLNVNTPALGVVSIDLAGAGSTTNTVLMPNSNSFTANAITVGGHNGIAVTNGRGTVNQTTGTTTISAAPGGHLTVGWGGGSTGSYTLGGGALVANNSEWIGYGGVGFFSHSGGTNTINGAANHLYVGCCAGGSGDYTISGTASLNVGGDAIIGTFGTGSLNILAQSSVYINDALTIGTSSTVNLNGGTLRVNTIDGSGGLSRFFHTAGTLRLAGNRDLMFDTTITTLFGAVPTIPSGKGLAIEGIASIYSNSAQTFRVNGGTLSTFSSMLEVGKFTGGSDGFDGQLEVTNGGIVTSGEGRIGFDDLTNGTATVSGPGSRWNLSDELWVAGNGDGGVLNIRDGALVHVATTLHLWHHGVVNLDGGTIRFNDYLRFNTGSPVDGVFNFNSGTLQLAGNRNIGADAAILDILGLAPTFSAGKGLTVEGNATISSAVTLNGGTLRATNLAVSGAFHFGGGLLELTGGTISGLTNLAVPTGGEFRASGVQALRITGAAGSTITATGNLTLGNASAVNGFYSNGTLTVGTNTVTLNDANDATFDSGALVTIGSGASPGAVNAINGLTLDFGGNITGFGTITTPNNSAKPLINNGHIAGNSAAQRITLPGYVKGVGTFDNVNVTGTFSPGLSPTILSVGNITFSPTSTVIMELGGTTPGGGYDQLQSAGAIVLGGTLQISLISGFVPTVGQTFDLFDSATMSGTFSSIVLPSVPGLSWDTSQLASGMLSAAPGLSGDFNNNGKVDAADYVVWRKYSGTITALPNDPHGGTIGTLQFNTWRANFGNTAGSGANSTSGSGVPAVPEPGSQALLLAALLTLSVCRQERPARRITASSLEQNTRRTIVRA
jgi:T5SS/PEP-CTERM-associated repeat protein